MSDKEPPLSEILEGEHLTECNRCGRKYNWLVKGSCYHCDDKVITKIKELEARVNALEETHKVQKSVIKCQNTQIADADAVIAFYADKYTIRRKTCEKAREYQAKYSEEKE